jgi:hypothetical protein
MEFNGHAFELLVLANQGVTLEQWANAVRHMGEGIADFPFCQKILDEAKEYSQNQSENGKRGMIKRWGKHNDPITSLCDPITNHNDPVTSSSSSSSSSSSTVSELIHKGSKKKFIPPTIEDVSSYCIEKGYLMKADVFVNFYESKGWKVGENPMVNWKSAVSGWYSREKEKSTVKQRQNTPGGFR